MSVINDPAAQTLIEERLKANRWTHESLVKSLAFWIDSEGDGDDISARIASANEHLREFFQAQKTLITPEDIDVALERFETNDVDWLAHLDIAFEMAHANQNALTPAQVEKIARVAALSTGPHVTRLCHDDKLRASHASAFLNRLDIAA